MKIAMPGDMPVLIFASMVMLGISAVGALYAGWRIDGWRSLFPLPRKKSSLGAYRRSIREHGWPAWPFYLWVIGAPISIVMFVVGSLRDSGH